jgi:lysophospholipase L1-like esterase
MEDQKENVFIRILFTISMGILISLTSITGLKQVGWQIQQVKSGWVFFFLALIAFLVLFLQISNHCEARGKDSLWLLSVTSINLFLIIELALRFLNFEYRARIQFGYPRPIGFSSYFQEDKDLFWTLKPTDEGVNSLGFPGDEVAIPKPKDVFRIVFLGDSITQQNYANLVKDKLASAKNLNGKKTETILLAVAGYSSYQGRVMAEKYGELFEPDLAFVYFGWNDHWLAYGEIDAEKEIIVKTSTLHQIGRWVYAQSRISQLLVYLRDLLSDANSPIEQVRVPLDDYANNQRCIQEIFIEQSIPVVFITAPTSRYKVNVENDHLIDLNYAADQETVVQLHKEYNKQLRHIANTDGSYLLDLEAEFMDYSAQELAALFMRDGIHFTDSGLELVAERIVDFIYENELIRP